MRHYPTGFKRYERVHPRHILEFIRDELSKGQASELGEMAGLELMDLSRRTCYLITRDQKPVGFACVRFESNFRDCWLTHIYVSKEHRRTGCARYTIRGLKINRVMVPLVHEYLLVLLRQLGFQYCDNHPHGNKVADLILNRAEDERHERPTR